MSEGDYIGYDDEIHEVTTKLSARSILDPIPILNIDNLEDDEKVVITKKRALLFDSDDEIKSSLTDYSYTEGGKTELKNGSKSNIHRYHENDWSPENIKTVERWLKAVERADHMNEYMLDKYSRKFENYQTLNLGISSIASVLSSSAVISQFNESFKTFSLIVSIINACIIFVTTYCNGLLAIKKWDKKKEEMTKYDEKLNGMFGILKLELGKPYNLRMNAVEFILKHEPTLLEIISNGPKNLRSDELEALKAYNDYLASKERNEL